MELLDAYLVPEHPKPDGQKACSFKAHSIQKINEDKRNMLLEVHMTSFQVDVGDWNIVCEGWDALQWNAFQASQTTYFLLESRSFMRTNLVLMVKTQYKTLQINMMVTPTARKQDVE